MLLTTPIASNANRTVPKNNLQLGIGLKKSLQIIPIKFICALRKFAQIADRMRIIQ